MRGRLLGCWAGVALVTLHGCGIIFIRGRRTHSPVQRREVHEEEIPIASLIDCFQRLELSIDDHGVELGEGICAVTREGVFIAVVDVVDADPDSD